MSVSSLSEMPVEVDCILNTNDVIYHEYEGNGGRRRIMRGNPAMRMIIQIINQLTVCYYYQISTITQVYLTIHMMVHLKIKITQSTCMYCNGRLKLIPRPPHHHQSTAQIVVYNVLPPPQAEDQCSPGGGSPTNKRVRKWSKIKQFQQAAYIIGDISRRPTLLPPTYL